MTLRISPISASRRNRSRSPAVAACRAMLRPLVCLWRIWRSMREQEANYAILKALSDRELRDMGLGRSEIRHIVSTPGFQESRDRDLHGDRREPR